MRKIYSLFALGALAIGLSALTIYRADAVSGSDSAPAYSLEIVNQYRTLAGEGYAALDKGDTETAIAKFEAQLKLIPEGKLGAYNMACVYGRTGKVDEGMLWLEKTINNGWDSPGDLETDPDFESLKAHPRFAALVAASTAIRDEKAKLLGAGLPEYDTPPVTFATLEELQDWEDERSDLIKKSNSVWQNWQYNAAKMEFYAQKLAALHELKKGDPDFDYGLERVRTIGNILTVWDCWNDLSDGVVKEADAYLSGSPSADGANEANYLAGLALTKKYCDENGPEISAARDKADTYLAKVAEESPFHGSAQAWMLDHRLAQAGEGADALNDDVKKLVEKCRRDKDVDAMRVIAISFHDRAVKSIWPIALSGKDVNGEETSLDQYLGKVLLIDFWATWCGPCLAELPNLRSVYEKYNSQGLEVLSISLDRGARTSVADLKTWTKERGMPWRHIYEGSYWDDRLAAEFLVKSIPAAFLVGRDGSLVAMGEETHGGNLERNVKKALTGDVH